MTDRKGSGKPRSVRSSIRAGSVLMAVVTIVICALIGALCVKIYWEGEERALEQAFGDLLEKEQAQEMIENITVHNRLFVMMAVLFAVLSVLTLFVVSRIFATLLTRRIMEPLTLLERGAERIRGGDCTTPIIYDGEVEFVRVCDTFNAMQRHLLEERERNERYEKARQEMIAGISHDLRSPLTAVRGTVKALLDGVVTDPAKQQVFLQAAYRRSGEMDSLLTQLFYFSKLETGGIPVNIRSLDLADYLQNYFAARKEQPDGEGIDFVLELPEEELPPVLADPEALQRILDNLLSNSRRYAGADPLRILVRLTQKGGTQELALQDNGQGVPEDKLGRIFEEFFRADESRNKKEGSGLGLYIVKYLAEAMHGSVRADMTPRGDFAGLAVTVDLPEGGADGTAAGSDSDH